MLPTPRNATLPIGLDIGSASIRLLQVQATPRHLQAQAMAWTATPADMPEDAVRRVACAASIARQMLRAGGFHGRRIVLALPPQLVQVKSIRLPSIPPTELAQAAEFEAAEALGIDPQQSVIRHLHAGEVRQGGDTWQEVILVAADRGQVGGVVHAVHEAGLVLDSIDFLPSALYRSVERFIRRREDEKEVHVLVEFGHQRSHVVIGRGREISFYKQVPVGSVRIHDAVATTLGVSVAEAATLRRRTIDAERSDGAAVSAAVREAIDDAARPTMEELARELALCLRYYSVTFRGQRPSRVRVSGGEGGDPLLRQVLGAALTIPVEESRALGSVDLGRLRSDQRERSLAGWSTALGLALRRCTEYYGARDGRSRSAAPVEAAAPADEPPVAAEAAHA